MNKELKCKSDLKPIILCCILQIVITGIFIAVFAALMYFLETDNKYAPVFGSISVAAGDFASSYFLSAKKKNKGYLIGLTVGIITFLAVTLISLITDDGGITVNTLFHFIIIMLSALTGGIMGVNKRKEKYI